VTGQKYWLSGPKVLESRSFRWHRSKNGVLEQMGDPGESVRVQRERETGLGVNWTIPQDALFGTGKLDLSNVRCSFHHQRQLGDHHTGAP
jgi:hypothetical protein